MNSAKVHYSCPINSAKGAGKKKKKTKQNKMLKHGRVDAIQTVP